MKIYTIEENIDLGNHVIKMFSSQELAEIYTTQLPWGRYELVQYDVDSDEEYGKIIKDFKVEQEQTK